MKEERECSYMHTCDPRKGIPSLLKKKKKIIFQDLVSGGGLDQCWLNLMAFCYSPEIHIEESQFFIGTLDNFKFFSL